MPIFHNCDGLHITAWYDIRFIISHVYMVPCWHAGCCTYESVLVPKLQGCSVLQCAAECKLTWCIESPQLQRATVTEDSAPHTGHWAPGHSRSGGSRSCYSLLPLSTTCYFLTPKCAEPCADMKAIRLNMLQNMTTKIERVHLGSAFKWLGDFGFWVCLGDCVRQLGSAMVWQCGCPAGPTPASPHHLICCSSPLAPHNAIATTTTLNNQALVPGEN